MSNMFFSDNISGKSYNTLTILAHSLLDFDQPTVMKTYFNELFSYSYVE